MTSATKRLALNAPYCPCQAKAMTVAKIIETAAANPYRECTKKVGPTCGLILRKRQLLTYLVKRRQR